MDEPDGVGAAVERLYEVFSSYPLREVTDVCWCCHTEEQERAVHAAPLRVLSPEQLEAFALDALYTWGDVADLKHFVPRLLEIVAGPGFPAGVPEREWVVDALNRAGWARWPSDQHQAVAEFLWAWWQRELPMLPDEYDRERSFVAITVAVEDLTPYLRLWAASSAPAAAVRYARFFTGEASARASGGKRSYLWLSERPSQERQVADWLEAERGHFQPRLEQLLGSESHADYAPLLTEALSALRM